MTGQANKQWPIPPALVAWGGLALAIIIGVSWAASAGVLTWSMAVGAREAGQAFVAGYAPVAYALYAALFVVMALVLFPAQLWIIVIGAMLFGFWPALVVSWAAAVLSAVCVFMLARGALAARYHHGAGKYLARIEAEFHKDQLSWMLVMRFIPVVPYCISNVAPALLGARLTPFLIASMIGVVPYVAAYTFVGGQAGEVLDTNAPPDLGSIAGHMLPIMLAVAALPLLALVVKRLKSQ
jgi:uncharacterized membrane protein YdjX (TVP38/TMEM64 family)